MVLLVRVQEIPEIHSGNVFTKDLLCHLLGTRRPTPAVSVFPSLRPLKVQGHAEGCGVSGSWVQGWSPEFGSAPPPGCWNHGGPSFA